MLVVVTFYPHLEAYSLNIIDFIPHLIFWALIEASAKDRKIRSAGYK